MIGGPLTPWSGFDMCRATMQAKTKVYYRKDGTQKLVAISYSQRMLQAASAIPQRCYAVSVTFLQIKPYCTVLNPWDLQPTCLFRWLTGYDWGVVIKAGSYQSYQILQKCVLKYVADDNNNIIVFFFLSLSLSLSLFVDICLVCLCFAVCMSYLSVCII